MIIKRFYFPKKLHTYLYNNYLTLPNISIKEINLILIRLNNALLISKDHILERDSKSFICWKITYLYTFNHKKSEKTIYPLKSDFLARHNCKKSSKTNKKLTNSFSWGAVRIWLCWSCSSGSGSSWLSIISFRFCHPSRLWKEAYKILVVK